MDRHNKVHLLGDISASVYKVSR